MVLSELVMVAAGLLFAARGILDLRSFLKSQSRHYVRTTGTVVGLESRPGGNARRAIFEFVDDQGRSVRTACGWATRPWPRLGRLATIVYDPADPAGTADTLASHHSKPVLGVLLPIVGIVLFVAGLLRINDPIG